MKPRVFIVPRYAIPTKCSACGASIVWITPWQGDRTPVEAEGARRGQSHVPNCTQTPLGGLLE
jgi:hypothetical protein